MATRAQIRLKPIAIFGIIPPPLVGGGGEGESTLTYNLSLQVTSPFKGEGFHKTLVSLF